MSYLVKFRSMLCIRNSRLCFPEYCFRNPTINNFSSQTIKKDENEGEGEPMSYLNSEAAKWPARYSRTLGTDERLWYQPLVVSFSLTFLLVYFCILREENDIDDELYKNLYTRIPALEQNQLELSRQHFINNNMNTDEIDKRLKELKG